VDDNIKNMRLIGKKGVMKLKTAIFEVKRVGSVLFMSVLFLAIANLNFANAEARKAPQPVSEVSAKMDNSTHNFPNEPQDFVVCTGWHALCTASTDCQMNGNIADCDCMRVNETHIVYATEIQDTMVKHLTLAKCTYVHPCDVDQAPVCKAIKSGQYEVDHVKYDWVSTYSYRGWWGLLEQGLKACDPTAEGYTGDSYWAICDLAPCTEIQNPSDPDKPLSCQCRVVADTPFVGMNDSCTGNNGGIMSSMPLWAWDFQNNTYTFPMPGYEYVRGACAPLGSDPLPQQ
jgi:hypothetical protein